MSSCAAGEPSSNLEDRMPRWSGTARRLFLSFLVLIVFFAVATYYARSAPTQLHREMTPDEPATHRSSELAHRLQAALGDAYAVDGRVHQGIGRRESHILRDVISLVDQQTIDKSCVMSGDRGVARLDAKFGHQLRGGTLDR